MITEDLTRAKTAIKKSISVGTDIYTSQRQHVFKTLFCTFECNLRCSLFLLCYFLVSHESLEEIKVKFCLSVCKVPENVRNNNSREARGEKV